MATLPNVPDLPTPITPDRPEPIELPVEPDHGVPGTMTVSQRAGRNGMAFHFLANRQFMFAAAFRWPRTSASLRTV